MIGGDSNLLLPQGTIVDHKENITINQRCAMWVPAIVGPAIMVTKAAESSLLFMSQYLFHWWRNINLLLDIETHQMKIQVSQVGIDVSPRMTDDVFSILVACERPFDRSTDRWRVRWLTWIMSWETVDYSKRRWCVMFRQWGCSCSLSIHSPAIDHTFLTIENWDCGCYWR